MKILTGDFWRALVSIGNCHCPSINLSFKCPAIINLVALYIYCLISGLQKIEAYFGIGEERDGD